MTNLTVHFRNFRLAYVVDDDEVESFPLIQEEAIEVWSIIQNNGLGTDFSEEVIRDYSEKLRKERNLKDPSEPDLYEIRWDYEEVWS